jgi:hypothetical protein
VEKPDGRKQLERPRRRWEDNIKMNVCEVEWGGGAWTGQICLRTGRRGGLL